MTTYSKSHSFFEAQRKLISRIFAATLVVAAVVTIPAGFSSHFYAGHLNFLQLPF